MAEVERPFPLPVAKEEQEEWIDAVLATPGVNVPREALSNIAPFLVEPHALLTVADGAGRRKLTENALRRIVTDAGGMTVVAVRMHGVGGVVWENNERISSAWHSLADPSKSTKERRSLPQIHAWTGAASDGREQAFAALRSSVASRAELIADVNLASEALGKRVGHRPYDLKQDLVLNGQLEPGLFVAQQFQLVEPPLVGDDGQPLHPAEHWGWMAVRGNNRTKERQEIFGVSSAEVLTGVPLKRLGGEGETLVFDPDDWLRRLSETLNDEYAAAGGWDPERPSRAVRAMKVAVVDAHLVVGSSTPHRLYRIAQMSNRRDHVHPPLEFTQNDRGRALARSVLGAYVAAGLLDEKTAEVLSGSAPVVDLPDAPSDAKVSELRDLRSMLLLRELFPADRHKRFVIRRVLSESPPSQLTAMEVNRRARAWSALTSESYPKAWNPRIGEMFQASDVRDGVKPSDRPLRDLLAAADTDDAAFEELVSYRAAHWLAAFGIIDADRGSLTGQKADEDDGTEATRVRRTVRNTLNALRNNNRKQAVAVLRELASAMDHGDRKPRKVSASGELLYETMNRTWFNLEFPKATGKRPSRSKVSGAGTVTAPPPVVVPQSSRPDNDADGTGRPSALPLLEVGGAPESQTAHQDAGQNTTSTTRTPDPGSATCDMPEAQSIADPSGLVPESLTIPAPGPEGTARLQQWADELKLRVSRLLDESRLAKEVLDRMTDRAREEDVPYVFSRGQADAIAREVPRTLRTLRELPELVEALAEPAD
ncbi:MULTISPECIES: hypothetical protein [Streptomyces]|uniref:hypothetical protein n=1 Tax=Streptomyces TaxID=1883 RepID=UPI0014881847|nr:MULTISPECIES: hypothetical protein [Streptomyces]